MRYIYRGQSLVYPMAVEWKTVLIIVGITALCFLGIPVHVNKRSDIREKEVLFRTFIHRYNKSYDRNSTEYAERFVNFQETLNQIEILNIGRTSNFSAVYGLTKFSDLSPDEFVNRHLQPQLHERLRKPHHQRKSHHHYHDKEFHKYRKKIDKRAIEESLPLRIDWREKNVVSSIRNQKTCGACWAFSTIETVESMSALKTGTLQALSVQEMIDCAGYGNLGCSGGDTCSLLDWLVANKIHVEPEKEYPLTWETDTCKLKGSGIDSVQVASYSCGGFVAAESEMLATLAFHGPIIVAINALSWQYYLGGVIQFHCDGSPDHINHAVQIVGYDKTAPVPHYIVRNSWGPEFGDKGYLYIAIGSNLCGLATEVASLDVL